MSLPSLPQSDTPYSSNICNGAQILHSHYETTRAVLSSGNHNKHRLQHHAHLIFNDVLPLLLVLEEVFREDEALVDWLQDVSERFLGLTTHVLDLEAEAVRGHFVSTPSPSPTPVRRLQSVPELVQHPRLVPELIQHLGSVPEPVQLLGSVPELVQRPRSVPIYVPPHRRLLPTVSGTS
jgi:hypothetical protein